ncbi:MAG: hypothetical protein NTX52_13540 [Planctomycetota bacterium]|nr:hypothetical protein [Planctomycetota bacterium]
MECHLVILEYLKVVLTWPVLGSSAFVLVIWWLRNPLDFLLRNISIRMPSGMQIQAQQPQSKASHDTEKPGTITLDPQQQQELTKFVQELQQELKLSSDQQTILRDEIQKAWSAARFWELMYLDRYLVIHTKLLLSMMHKGGGQTTREYIVACWPSFNWGDEREREAVLNALQTSGLIEQIGNILKVTDKGRAFLAFIGYV